MKNLFFYLFVAAVSLASAGQIKGQNKNVSPVGIWQLSIPSAINDGTSVNFVPVWKEYYPGGKFIIVNWKSDKQSASITNCGTYVVESDSVIVEEITYSVYNAVGAEKLSRITTEYLDNSCMISHHHTESAEGRWQELWKRVLPGEPVNSSAIFKNSNDSIKVACDGSDIYFITEQMPKYVGGNEKAMMRFVQSQISYPAEALEKGLEGTSMVRFVVNEEGKPENFQLMHVSYKLLDDEAIRVIKTLRFVPGKHHGHNVKVYMTIPVSFKLR